MHNINLFLNSIKTASLAKSKYAYVSYSNTNSQILFIFLQEGFILNYTLDNHRYKIELNYTFPYKKLSSVIFPGNRKYLSVKSIKRNFSWAIVSSARGIEKWPNLNNKILGGEVLCGFKLT